MRLDLNLEALNNWLPNKKPLVISGPCSAETEEQVHKTAEGLKSINSVGVFRAGIWKPRTRPNTFEGIGREGLKWLVDAAKANGFKSATEVANGNHVEESLKAGVDILWVGARTTVNPFSVQEIADALKGVDIPIMVKNPIHPDLALWIGALERINRAGITKLAAVHRGFSVSGKSIYRNQPMWDLAIELKTLCPTLPMFCDPSHIAGKRDLLLEVSQRAIDLGMEGLMLETHPDPDNAWSDASQQITPNGLQDLLSQIQVRQVTSDSSEYISQLEKLRASIDQVDQQLLNWLAERMDVVEKIGAYKKENDVTVLQVERWNEIRATRKKMASELGLNVDFVDELLKVIHNESIKKQTAILNMPNTEKKN